MGDSQTKEHALSLRSNRTDEVRTGMIEIMTDLPDHVLGVKGTGEVTTEDYKRVLVPALEKKLKAHRRVRLLYVLADDFRGITPGAAWQDAKVGMSHLTAFERMALVTEVDWIEKTVKAFGFAMPGEVRVFDDDDLQAAREWVCEPLPAGDLEFDLMEDSGVLVLRPNGALDAGDFDRLTETVDPYIEAKGGLKGLMIDAKHFPGWDDFAAMLSHLRFVKDHQKKIQRVAFVSDDRLLGAIPSIASKFISAEVRAFPNAQRDEALVWLGSG